MSEDVRVLCEWIDRTLELPVYRAVARDSYAEGVVDTLKTVRKLLSKPSGSAFSGGGAGYGKADYPEESA